MKSNDPKPGSAEYDAMMAERYRRQWEPENPVTDTGEKADSYDHIRNANGSVRFSVLRNSTFRAEHSQEHYSAEAADPAQVLALEREVERIRTELAEVMRHDPRTGEPIPRFTGTQRRARELRLEHLERSELPATRLLQARAQQWRAQNIPTTEERLLTDKARREAIDAKALSIAEEREAEEEARRLLARRGIGISR